MPKADDELNTKEKMLITAEAGLNLVPYVGGPLAKIYFGFKQEIRLKRIERFYNELSERMLKYSRSDFILENVNKSALAAIIEEIHEGIEQDFAEERLLYFQNCFINSLTTDGEKEHQKKRYFISVISKLSDTEIEILSTLSKAPKGDGLHYDDINEDGAAEFNAALERLKSLGFLNAILNGKLKQNIQWGEITHHTLSDFGKEFVEYCLTIKLD